MNPYRRVSINRITREKGEESGLGVGRVEGWREGREGRGGDVG